MSVLFSTFVFLFLLAHLIPIKILNLTYSKFCTESHNEAGITNENRFCKKISILISHKIKNDTCSDKKEQEYEKCTEMRKKTMWADKANHDDVQRQEKENGGSIDEGWHTSQVVERCIHLFPKEGELGDYDIYLFNPHFASIENAKLFTKVDAHNCVDLSKQYFGGGHYYGSDFYLVPKSLKITEKNIQEKLLVVKENPPDFYNEDPSCTGKRSFEKRNNPDNSNVQSYYITNSCGSSYFNQIEYVYSVNTERFPEILRLNKAGITRIDWVQTRLSSIRKSEYKFINEKQQIVYQYEVEKKSGEEFNIVPTCLTLKKEKSGFFGVFRFFPPLRFLAILDGRGIGNKMLRVVYRDTDYCIINNSKN